MKPLAPLLLILALSAGAALAADPPSSGASSSSSKFLKIRPKSISDGGSGELLAPDVDLIDTPTSAVLDYGGYSARSRFYRAGGILQYVSFGVFQGVNLGASMTVDGIIGDNRTVRVRAPAAQVKWRFYDGDRNIPSLAVGYDGQGFDYNQIDRRYNHRQKGFFVVASQELGYPGLMVHPGFNISDFDSNAIFGFIPVSFNIRDKVLLMAEWDNINNFSDSRLNSGIRVYVTPHFDVDFAVRGIGQGGYFANGDPRGPERVVQLRYSANF